MQYPIAKNQKGSALILAIMVLLVLSILGTALLSVVAGNMRTSAAERKFQSAYYVAEAGAVYHMKAIKKELLNLYLSAADSIEFFNEIETYRMLYPMEMNTFETEYGSQPKAEISFERLDALGSNPCTYRITSKGTLDNSTRTVTNKFKVQWVSGFMSVFSKDQMILENGQIYGPIGTNDTDSDAILVTGNPYIEDINLLDGAGLIPPYADWLTNWASRASKFTLNEPKVYEMPAFPTFPVYAKIPDATVDGFQVINGGSINITNYRAENYVLNMTDNVYIPKIQIKHNWNLYINVGDTDKAIVVDDIALESGHIHLIGDGKLTIYLTNSINLNAGSGINRPADESNVAQVTDAIEHLSFYMKGSSTGVPKSLDMAGSQKIYGSLFAEDANINVSGGAGFQGSVVTGGVDVKLSGGTNIVTSLFFAPNASVTLSGGNVFNGPVIANTFFITGGAIVRYNPRDGIVYNPFGVGFSVGLFDIIPMDGAVREK